MSSKGAPFRMVLPDVQPFDPPRIDRQGTGQPGLPGWLAQANCIHPDVGQPDLVFTHPSLYFIVTVIFALGSCSQSLASSSIPQPSNPESQPICRDAIQSPQ